MTGGHGLGPEPALPDVFGFELPVLPRAVDAPDEALALLFLRQMKEEPDDGCGVDEQVVLAVDGETVAVLPDVLRVAAGQRAPTGVVANYSDRLSTTTWETLATERPEPTM